MPSSDTLLFFQQLAKTVLPVIVGLEKSPHVVLIDILMGALYPEVPSPIVYWPTKPGGCKSKKFEGTVNCRETYKLLGSVNIPISPEFPGHGVKIESKLAMFPLTTPRVPVNVTLTLLPLIC